ncbi:hypothetical protein CS537_10310 [Yersinia mollaretii]|nr:hypothetical protein CS537_10310 [Yersinia mollaretii]
MLTAITLITGWNGSDGLKASAIFWRDNSRNGAMAGTIVQKHAQNSADAAWQSPLSSRPNGYAIVFVAILLYTDAHKIDRTPNKCVIFSLM